MSKKLIALVILNVITLVIPLSLWSYLVVLAKNGMSGTEFVALLIVPFLLVGYVVAFINVFTVVSYLRNGMLSQSKKLLCGIALLFSLAVIVLPIYSTIVSRNRGPKFVTSTTTTLEQAKNLIAECRLAGVSYVEVLGQQNLKHAEASATGLAIGEVRYDASPHTLFVSDRMRSQIEPLVENAALKCSETAVIIDEDAKLSDDFVWR